MPDAAAVEIGNVIPELPAEAREVVFTAPDGFPLAGTLFEGAGNKPAVLISSASAVPRGLYAGFAAAAVKAGARAALIYDYRGTGGSRRPAGWTRRIGMKDWALTDFPAAQTALESAAAGATVVGLGQSFGGQALGLSGTSDRFQRYAMVATLSGYWRGLDDNAGLKMFGIGVPLSLFFRDMPRWSGVGDPVPSSVFRDWARWCAMPNYFFDDRNFPETARYRDVRTPILSLGITDDVWGTPRAVTSLMRHYVHAPLEQRWVSPDDAGGQQIGHLGFFRSRFATTLWPPLIDWLLDGTPMTLGRRDQAQARSPFRME